MKKYNHARATMMYPSEFEHAKDALTDAI